MASLPSTQPLDQVKQPLHAALTRFFEAALFSLVLVAFIALAGTGKLDSLSLIFVLSAFGLKIYQILTGKVSLLSVRITSRLTIFYVAFAIADFFLISGELVGMTVHIVLFIMVVKLFSVQSPRDHFYLALIAFMMVLSAAILTVDGFFLGAFCLFLLLAAATFISMEMQRSLRTALQSEGSVVAVGTSAALVKRFTRSLTNASIWIVVCTVTGAGVIFFMLPRTSAGYLSAFTQRNDFVTGFSDEVKLGAIGQIKQSNSVVMRVRFNSQDVPTDLRWRGIAYNTFNGYTWSHRAEFISTRTGPEGKLDLQQARFYQFIAGLPRPNPPGPQHVTGYEVLMEPIGTNTFFLLPTPLAISTDTRDFWIYRTGYIMGNDPNRAISRYVANSDPTVPNKAQRESTDDTFNSESLKDYLQLPDNLDPRIPALSREMSKGQTSVFGRAQAVEQYLKQRFGYTLVMDTPSGKDPLAWFLFNRKAGHCEYFASAMAILLRAQGIPTRMINGFHGGEYNDVTGSYIVRARDAHSWVEVYVPGFGWATFDPTPASDVTTHTGWARVALYADALREFWREWVVNYDFSHQSTLARSSASQARQSFDAFRVWARSKYDSLLAAAKRSKEAAEGQPRIFALRAAIVLALLVLVFNWRRWLHRFRAWRLAAAPSRAPRAAATIWYLRLLRFLERRGFEKASGQTAQEFIRSIDVPLVREKVEEFIRGYERARFGGNSEDAMGLPNLYAQVEAAVKQ